MGCLFPALALMLILMIMFDGLNQYQCINQHGDWNGARCTFETPK